LPVQVFISYARDDNAPPPGPAVQPGFVSALYEYLAYQLKQLPHPRPELWRDIGKIERTDQFEPILEEEIAGSDFLIVVLSPNWLASEWCRRELKRFRERWAAEGDAKVRERILLINKTRIDRELRPPLLQGQEGHDFFAYDKEQHAGARERPYFVMGVVKDDRFVENISELASKLQRLTAEKSASPGETAAKADAAAPIQPNGRTVFIARPADDMRQHYDRIVAEIRGRAFTVVPETDIPNDDTAVGFLDADLAKAEVAIHLLGERRGYAPPEVDPIVPLQLARAALRARLATSESVKPEAATPAPDPHTRPPFCRILWAPKRLERLEMPDAAAPGGAAERDPLAVLAKFGEQLERDKIESGNLTQFVDFLVRHLDQTAPRRPVAARIDGGRQVYLDHDPDDILYVDELALALQARAMTPVLPVWQGPPATVRAFNKKQMQACDAVALCWGSASEVWAMSAASRLDQWRAAGRKERLPSALVAAPPRDRTKDRRLKIKPPQIDVVLDLTNRDKPAPEDLDPWLGPSGG